MMFKMKFVARLFAAAAIAAACAVPAFAQLQVANSTGGSQVALAPINLAAIQAGINNAQNTANVANNQANYAVSVGSNAQGTANWAMVVAQDAQNIGNNAQATANNAQNTANSIAGRVDRTWELAMATCALAMGGNRLFCELANPRPW